VTGRLSFNNIDILCSCSCNAAMLKSWKRS